MTSSDKPQVVVYTDGACSGNPGPGGWGVLLRFGGTERRLSGFAAETTNNRMELSAAIAALGALSRPCDVILWTDSQYVRQGITAWIHGWKRNGWKNSQKKPVLNAELWQELDEAAKPHNIDWRWVKGHAGDEGNEIVDELARQAVADRAGVDLKTKGG